MPACCGRGKIAAIELQRPNIRSTGRSALMFKLEDMFKLTAFYAEVSSLARHERFVDRMYMLKDCGVMTADCRLFSSPRVEVSFVLPEPGEVTRAPKIIVAPPTFGHRQKSRPFRGWIFGVKGRVGLPLQSEIARPSMERCKDRLARAVSCGPGPDVLDILDRLLDDLTDGVTIPSDAPRMADEAQVSELADRWGRSARTVHRQILRSTGLAPKRLLATNRFSRAVYDLSTQPAKLSSMAGELGFADQAHLTREFQRHAGLSPAAFRRSWQGGRGRAVRFVQDTAPDSRLHLAVCPSEGGVDFIQ